MLLPARIHCSPTLRFLPSRPEKSVAKHARHSSDRVVGLFHPLLRKPRPIAQIARVDRPLRALIIQSTSQLATWVIVGTFSLSEPHHPTTVLSCSTLLHSYPYHVSPPCCCLPTSSAHQQSLYLDASPLSALPLPNATPGLIVVPFTLVPVIIFKATLDINLTT